MLSTWVRITLQKGWLHTVGKGVFGGGRGGDVKAESEAQADVAQGTVHMRLAAITVVELAQDVTGALVCAHGVPRLFDAIGI